MCKNSLVVIYNFLILLGFQTYLNALDYATSLNLIAVQIVYFLGNPFEFLGVFHNGYSYCVHIFNFVSRFLFFAMKTYIPNLKQMQIINFINLSLCKYDCLIRIRFNSQNTHTRSCVVVVEQSLMDRSIIMRNFSVLPIHFIENDSLTYPLILKGSLFLTSTVTSP